MNSNVLQVILPNVQKLLSAVRIGNHERAIPFLQEYEWTPEMEEYFSKTIFLLHEACLGGSVTIVQELQKRIYKTNFSMMLETKNNDDVVPLHIACREGHFEVVKLLLECRKCTINIKSGVKCKTPLHFACESGNINIVKLLLENGAQKDVQSRSSGSYPVHVAARYGHVEVMEEFADFIDVEDSFRNTPLNIAIRHNQVKMVEFLLMK